MREFIAFTKKEFLEQLRTYKWLMVLSVMFLFGMMSPVLAKVMPEMIKDMDMGTIQIIVPKATVLDAYGQFFKTFTQMGMLVLFLVFGGTISNELTKGTLINILAKGLPRHTVILSKYTAAIILWTTGYVVSVLTNIGYTAFLFENTSVKNLLFSLFCLWLFCCFMIALIFLSSTLTTGYYGGLIISVSALAIMLMGNAFPKVQKINPVTLASDNLALLNNTKEVHELVITVFITVLLTILCLYLSIIIFRKKKL